jgi:hypothetical protein
MMLLEILIEISPDGKQKGVKVVFMQPLGAYELKCNSKKTIYIINLPLFIPQ